MAPAKLVVAVLLTVNVDPAITLKGPVNVILLLPPMTDHALKRVAACQCKGACACFGEISADAGGNDTADHQCGACAGHGPRLCRHEGDVHADGVCAGSDRR